MHEQSPGLAGLICNTQFVRGAKLSDTHNIIYRKIVPAVRLGGLTLLTNKSVHIQCITPTQHTHPDRAELPDPVLDIERE